MYLTPTLPMKPNEMDTRSHMDSLVHGDTIVVL